MKLLKKIFGLIFILLVILVFARNFVVKVGAEQAVKKVTGLPLKIEGLSIGLKETNVDIDDLKIYNPSNFQEKMMANVPDIYVDYNLPDIIKGNIHLNEIRFHLNEFIVVKNKAGQTNLDSLKALQQTKKEGEDKEKKKDTKKKPDVVIDNLSLRVDRVVYKDYSGGGEPKVQTFNVNINEVHTDIENLNTVVSLIVFKALIKTPIGALSGFDIQGLAGGLTGTLAGSAQMATEALGNAKGLLEGQAGNLKDKAKGLKGLFKKE